MSQGFDKMRQVRLYPDQLQRVIAVGQNMVVSPGLTALVNRCVTLGLPILESQVLPKKRRKIKTNHEQKKS